MDYSLGIMAHQLASVHMTYTRLPCHTTELRHLNNVVLCSTYSQVLGAIVNQFKNLLSSLNECKRKMQAYFNRSLSNCPHSKNTWLVQLYEWIPDVVRTHIHSMNVRSLSRFSFGENLWRPEETRCPRS